MEENSNTSSVSSIKVGCVTLIQSTRKGEHSAAAGGVCLKM